MLCFTGVRRNRLQSIAGGLQSIGIAKLFLQSIGIALFLLQSIGIAKVSLQSIGIAKLYLQSIANEIGNPKYRLQINRNTKYRLQKKLQS